jgi:hypothetical protein
VNNREVEFLISSKDDAEQRKVVVPIDLFDLSPPGFFTLVHQDKARAVIDDVVVRDNLLVPDDNAASLAYSARNARLDYNDRGSDKRIDIGCPSWLRGDLSIGSV